MFKSYYLLIIVLANFCTNFFASVIFPNPGITECFFVEARGSYVVRSFLPSREAPEREIIQIIVKKEDLKEDFDFEKFRFMNTYKNSFEQYDETWIAYLKKQLTEHIREGRPFLPRC
jgi:hypothetical protein